MIFLAAAESDLFAHYDRFEAVQSGAGEKFSATLDTGLTLISGHPCIAGLITVALIEIYERMLRALGS